MVIIQGQLWLRHFNQEIDIKFKTVWYGSLSIPDELSVEYRCELEDIHRDGMLPVTIVLLPFEPKEPADEGFRRLVCYIESCELQNEERIGFHFFVNVSGAIKATRAGLSATDHKFVKGYSATFLREL